MGESRPASPTQSSKPSRQPSPSASRSGADDAHYSGRKPGRKNCCSKLFSSKKGRRKKVKKEQDGRNSCYPSKCCLSKCCRRLRCCLNCYESCYGCRKCCDDTHWNCCWNFCSCCWWITPRDHDTMHQIPKKYPPNKPLPKITRREEHVEFIQRRPPKGSRHKEDNDIISRENGTEVYTALNTNETKVYFCTVQHAYNTKKYDPLVTAAELCSTGNKEKKGETDSTDQSKDTITSRAAFLSRRERSAGLNHLRSLEARKKCDSTYQPHLQSGCQSGLQSNQSLEIKSHVLTKSASQLSSIRSAFSIKWRRRVFQHRKAESALQYFLQKFKLKRRKKPGNSPIKRDKRDVYVVHLPKSYHHNSSAVPAMPSYSKDLEKPLVIRDESLPVLTFERRVTDKPQKICGPGEVLFQNRC